ncbi:MAG: CotH kinase family protein, partial [Phycisphaerales bacterium]
ADARALIPTDGSLGMDWILPGFDGSAWLAGPTGVGYDYGDLVGLDISAMRNVNETVYVRIPFQVDDVAAVGQLTLYMKYEDGFVAYLNGFEVARGNAPPADELTWNSGSLGRLARGDEYAVVFEDFDITAPRERLVEGENVLAIHGLNAGLYSSDLLVLPELVAVSFEPADLSDVVEGYLLQPTPGAPNQTALAQIGPAIRDVTENPPPPLAGEDLAVTARVSETLAPVLGVSLSWTVGFEVASRVPVAGMVLMVDDGTEGDAVANDGVYTAVIPGVSLMAGHMVRWNVDAVDATGEYSRAPLFPHRADSPEFYGTVVQDPLLNSELPVLQWFVENVPASESRGGTRCSVFFLDQFYDNVNIHIRGGSTSGAAKKHFKFRFNHGYKFQYNRDAPRVNEFNLNSTFSDKAYLRQNLAFNAYDWCGCPGSESFPVRAQRNGEFFGVQIFIEEPEEELLEREGLDPDGALYKIYDTFNVGAWAEKKTRRWEGQQDLNDFRRAINNASGTTLHNNILDYVDLPRTLNYLAATILCHQNDHPHKNHYLYCDSDGSGQWCFLPWDHDLTWGSNWIGSQGGSYGDVIYAADDRVPGRSSDVKPSHPFVGKRDCQEWNRHWNHLIDALFNDDVVREMYLRRLRTVMDDFLKPPGTPYEDLFIENRIDELVLAMRRDVALDYAKWANPWPWGGQDGYPRDQSFQYAIDVIKEDYLAVRRTHLFITHNVDRVASYNIPGSYSAAIPNAQPADAKLDFGTYEFNPPSGNQEEEYIELVNPNAYAVDISDWQLTGGVEHTFLPGTVIVAGGSLYVSPSARAFLNRTASPTGTEGRFVQGNYRGHLSSWGEAVELTDRHGRLVATLTYPGEPSDQQRYLRITEIMYNPGDSGSLGSDEYEFIELQNIGTVALPLAGVKLTDGVTYAFADDASVTLAPGSCIVIVKNRDAFAERYDASTVDLAPGTYAGSLSNGGETIKLEDRTNSTILEFEYQDDWFDETDGLGYSLTLKHSANPDPAGWDDADVWQASTNEGGSPGTD